MSYELSFSWKRFRENRIAIHCPDKQCAKDFLRQCVERGIIVPFSIESGFWSGPDTCYAFDFDAPHKNRVAYSKKYEEQGYLIYTWKYPLKHFTKNDMQNGMIVELRNGKRYLWHENECINIDSHVEGIRHDLCGSTSEFDVMKIFTGSPVPLINMFNNDNLFLIWTREFKG